MAKLLDDGARFFDYVLQRNRQHRADDEAREAYEKQVAPAKPGEMRMVLVRGGYVLHPDDRYTGATHVKVERLAAPKKRRKKRK